MPSAANGKSEKPASSEATDNSPIRQIMTVMEHKIRNLEKRKSKLTSYLDLQKAGKVLNTDQKVAVAKYDEVVQTLEFARDLAKQVSGIVAVAEREAKKQAKKEAWVRNATETNKVREVLLVLDCLVQMGNSDARKDFLDGANGAAKLTEDDLKILDDLYPEVNPKHEANEEGQAGFHGNSIKAAEHLCAIIDGKSKEVLGTTYTHIKEIVTTVHECGYFDKIEGAVPENVEVMVAEEVQECVEEEIEPEATASVYAPPLGLPVPPAPGVVPAPGYPLCPLPPITLQEVEHAYFAQQYPPQQRPISEVIGSQNFFFLQDSEIDSPVGTPQPPPIMNQPSPSGIPSQTFTNQHFVQLPGGHVADPSVIPIPPQPHFPPHPDHVAFAAVPMQAHLTHQQQAAPQPPLDPVEPLQQQPAIQPEDLQSLPPVNNKNEDEWKDHTSERDEGADRKGQGHGDGQNRFRRFGGRGGVGGARGSTNGYRGGRTAFQSRQGGDYRDRHGGGEYQSRPGKDSYQNRQYDNYQNRRGKDDYQPRGNHEGYYRNGDASDGQQNENGGRDRYNDNTQNYQGGFKSRGRGGSRGGPPRGPRPHQYNRKPENVE